MRVTTQSRNLGHSGLSGLFLCFVLAQGVWIFGFRTSDSKSFGVPGWAIEDGWLRLRSEFQDTHRPLSSSFLGLPCMILKISHKQELVRCLWVRSPLQELRRLGGSGLVACGSHCVFGRISLGILCVTIMSIIQRAVTGLLWANEVLQ